jgi:hypothetical protein
MSEIEMSLPSPTLEGFRAAVRCPSLTFAEMTWRWAVGAIAWTLFLFSFIEYLNTLPVTRGDKTLLGTRQPLLIGKAISHILRGSLDRAVFTASLAMVAVALLWVISASIGRGVTVRALLDYFRKDVSVDDSSEPKNQAAHFYSLVALNVLRVAVALAAILAFAGGAILAGFVSTNKNPQPGLAFVLFLPFAASICVVWPALNWLLSLASVFAIRDGEDVFGAVSAAALFSRERTGPVLAVGTWTGLAHLVALSVAGTAVSLPLAFVGLIPGRLILALIILLALTYFAVVDWLYIARLAAYVCMVEMPEVQVPSTPQLFPQIDPGDRTETAIDRTETILSDMPHLAAET